LKLSFVNINPGRTHIKNKNKIGKNRCFVILVPKISITVPITTKGKAIPIILAELPMYDTKCKPIAGTSTNNPKGEGFRGTLAMDLRFMYIINADISGTSIPWE
jgi:hypothetical protein